MTRELDPPAFAITVLTLALGQLAGRWLVYGDRLATGLVWSLVTAAIATFALTLLDRFETSRRLRGGTPPAPGPWCRRFDRFALLPLLTVETVLIPSILELGLGLFAQASLFAAPLAGVWTTVRRGWGLGVWRGAAGRALLALLILCLVLVELFLSAALLDGRAEPALRILLPFAGFLLLHGRGRALGWWAGVRGFGRLAVLSLGLLVAGLISYYGAEYTIRL